MSTVPLTRVKSPYADVMDDTSTSLPGFVAEEVVEQQDYGSITNDGVYTDTDRNSDDEDPNDGYLLPWNQTMMVLVPLYLLTFLASLDSTILSTLMTDIASDLNAIPYISWIATSYLFSTSIIQPMGKLSDIFGRKPSLLLCISVFTVGCLQCATSNSVLSFASGRFLSGFAAGLNTLNSIITTDLIPLRNRGVYQGIGNIFFALGSAVGGTCGGYISQNWGWRMAFWFQVPIGLACFFVIFYGFNLPVLPHEIKNKDISLKDKLKKVDILGIFLIAFNLLVLITMTSSSFEGRTVYGVLFVALIAGLYALFQAERSHENALIPIGLMKNRSVLGASLANWFGTMYSYILMYYVPVYMTTVLDINSQGVGVRLLPNIVVASFASIGSGLYMKWTGKYLKFLVTVTVIGILNLVYILYRTHPKTPELSLFEQYTLSTLSLGSYSCMLTVTLLALIAAVPLEFQSSVTSIQYAFRSMGSTLGTSFSSYIFTTQLLHNLKALLTQNRPDGLTDFELQQVVEAALHDAKYIRSTEAPEWAVGYMIESYNISTWTTFLFAFFICILGFVGICLIKENKLHTSVKR